VLRSDNFQGCDRQSWISKVSVAALSCLLQCTRVPPSRSDVNCYVTANVYYVTCYMHMVFPRFQSRLFHPWKFGLVFSFQSCDFHPCALVPCFPVPSLNPCDLVPRFPVLTFPVPRFQSPCSFALSFEVRLHRAAGCTTGCKL